MINTSQTILSQKDADNHALVKEFTNIKKELVTTETPMKKLSQLFGFNSPAMLTKFVKSTTGISPSKYRALNYVE